MRVLLFLALLFSQAFGGTWFFVKSSASFTPASISGLENWYDCSDESTMTVSGSDISQLNDKSGNARHATMATSTKRPDKVTSCQNGLTCCRFDGTDDNFVASTGTDRSTFSVVAVLKSSRQRRFDAIIDTVSGVTGDLTLEVGSGNNTIDFWINNVSAAATSVGTWSASTVFDAMFTYNNSTLVTYINNAGSGSQSSSGRVFRQNFAIGGNYASAGFFHWKDDIYEVLIYSKVLDSTERSNLRTYFTAKWGY